MSDISKSSTTTIPMDKQPKTESAASSSPTKKVIKFHSRAKLHSDEAYLSNFQLVPGGLVIDCVPYLTVEHYYQSMKFKDKDRGMFKGLDAELRTGKQAKSAGGRGAMRKLFGYGLSMVRWKGPSDTNDEDFKCIRVMKRALWARFQQDRAFQDILTQENVRFEHYEKPRGKFDVNKIPEWGCYFDQKHTGTTRGLNILGNLYNELNAFHTIPDFFEYNGKLNWSGSTKEQVNYSWFPYPRNTFNVMRDEEKYGKQYKQCGFAVRDSDVVHPFMDPATILHA